MKNKYLSKMKAMQWSTQ